MKVLLFTSKEEDYLQDSIIHGFKELFGNNAIEFPIKDMLYDDYKALRTVRGNGFTLYGLLSPALKPAENINIEQDIALNKFDLIVFTSIYRQYKFFYKHLNLLLKTHVTVWIIDGEDSPILFPYLGKHLKRFLGAVKPHKHFIYFKRELSPETLNSIYLRFPVSKFGKTSFPRNVKPISFSIPNEKIIDRLPAKTKLFTAQIVDSEVADKLKVQTRQDLFETEAGYYLNIQASKFGITTKRAGWDCLRHYEIAANGAVICFKDLHKKPAECAPHGLIQNKNCISYSDFDDLLNKIKRLGESEYLELQTESLNWAISNSTKNRVSNLLNQYYKSAY